MAMAMAISVQGTAQESHPAATSPLIATPPPRPAPAAAAAPASHRLARLAFVIGTVLMSASWFVEPFIVAAVPRLPWAAVVGTVVLLAAIFCATIHLFHSSFVPRPPAAAAAQFGGVGAIAAAVLVGVAACLVAACGSAYGYAPAPARS